MGNTVGSSAEKPSIFISYARSDSTALAEELVGGLKLAQFEPYLDRHDIAPAEDWEARLGALIQSADTVVFILSPAAVGSERCKWEVDRAVELGKRLIPVRGKPVPDASVPAPLRRLNYIDFREGQSVTTPLTMLVAALRQEAHALAGEPEKGLAAIADSFAMAERNGDRSMLSEMYRLAGHVSEAAQQLEIAEERYERAIHIAQGQRAKSLELRAATDLGRLFARRGEMPRATTLLRPLCAFFVEGLTNQDFIDAKSLMERCASHSGSFRPLPQ
jgi:hypothetical protein